MATYTVGIFSGARTVFVPIKLYYVLWFLNCHFKREIALKQALERRVHVRFCVHLHLNDVCNYDWFEFISGQMSVMGIFFHVLLKAVEQLGVRRKTEENKKNKISSIKWLMVKLVYGLTWANSTNGSHFENRFFFRLQVLRNFGKCRQGFKCASEWVNGRAGRWMRYEVMNEFNVKIRSLEGHVL